MDNILFYILFIIHSYLIKNNLEHKNVLDYYARI